jgi:hypothetical protein
MQRLILFAASGCLHATTAKKLSVLDIVQIFFMEDNLTILFKSDILKIFTSRDI